MENYYYYTWPVEFFDMMNYVLDANLSMGGGKLLVLLLEVPVQMLVIMMMLLQIVS